MVQKSPSFFICLVVGISGLLGACSGNQALENRFAPNPALENPTTTQTTPTPDLSPTEETPEPQNPPTSEPQTPISEGTFSDLGDLGDRQRAEIEDLSKLGILQGKTGQEFAPQAPITRGEFARWLFQANNVFFANQPGKQIRPAPATANAVFTDVPKTAPGFSEIQGLADAGLIASSLTNDPSATLFRPDAPLTREDLLRWKVPLDQRRALPNASLENIKETWGFQDAAKINPNLWPALAADFQNGDRANIKRIFGYITILQPQRTVTRGEAASALWFLGSQTEGLSAKDVLNTPAPETPETPEVGPSPDPTVSPSP